MRRLTLFALLFSLAAGGASAAPDATNAPLLGVAGKAERFESLTGQDSHVRHVFLGWEQGREWGSSFSDLFDSLRPTPMIHLGTDRGRARVEAINPGRIARGDGDGYLIALNEAIAEFGGRFYVRPLAEMNNPKNLYSPRRPDGTSRGADYSPAAYKRAFRRIYLILHGGAVDAKLRALRLPPIGRTLTRNPRSRLTVIWNPLAGLDSGSPRPAQEFYPGDAYVDMVGNDLYASRVGTASHAANEALYRAHPSKPYAIPEWGLSVDDPGFVRRICEFLKSHRRTRLAAFYEARPNSPYDIESKPRSRAAYRSCVTPIGSARPRG